MRKHLKGSTIKSEGEKGYAGLLTGVSELLEQARHAAARTVNQILTATYREIGRRIVEFEQQGERRAEYGKRLLQRLAKDLTSRFGKGFGYSNLNLIRQFYLTYQYRRPILQSPIGESEKGIPQSVSEESMAIQKGKAVSKFLPLLPDLAKKESKLSQTVSAIFPLSWTHYVRLIALDDQAKCDFYEVSEEMVREQTLWIGIGLKQVLGRSNSSQEFTIIATDGVNGVPKPPAV